MATSETLRSVIDAGKTKRLDELSAARVIGKAAQQLHAAQQKAGAGKSVGPISPAALSFAESGEVSLALPATGVNGYASPEQAAGGSGDRRSDVFSLGVVMWEALTHQRLFDAMNDAAVKAAIAEREIKSPSEINANIPAELAAICMRALARNPADRYGSAKAMAVEIEEFLEEAGYADNDERIATFLKDMHKKPPLPQPTRTAGATAPPSSAMPSVLTAPPSGVVAAPADKASTSPGLGPSVLVAPAQAQTTRTANGTSPPAPGSTIEAEKKPNGEKASPSQTIMGVAAAADGPRPPAAVEAKTEPKVEAKPEPKVEAKPEPKVEAKPEPKPSETAPGIGAMTASPAVPLVPATPVLPAPPVLPASATIAGTAAAKAKDATPLPVTPVAATTPQRKDATPAPRKDATPAPRRDATPAKTDLPEAAGAVSLPHAPRESKDVLAGWGWGTDSHQAIDDDEDFHAPHTNNKKLLMFLIGGAVVFAAMIAVIMSLGGSKKKHAPPPAAATTEGSNAALAGSATEPGSAVVASTDLGSAVAGSAEVASADVGSAAPAMADTGSASPAIGSANAAGSAAVATTGPINPYPDTPDTTKPDTTKPDTTAKIETTKPKTETKKVETTKPKTETKKVETGKPKTETPKPPKTTKPKTDVAKTTKSDKAESTAAAEAAYKDGIMKFARGDTTGSLAALRTSLAANPGYAPTWRGLGLVFEKLGEKDQARAAFKRYLQLAPSAGDADQIRGRMERL